MEDGEKTRARGIEAEGPIEARAKDKDKVKVKDNVKDCSAQAYYCPASQERIRRSRQRLVSPLCACRSNYGHSLQSGLQ